VNAVSNVSVALITAYNSAKCSYISASAGVVQRAISDSLSFAGSEILDCDIFCSSDIVD
jgi:hypothetical protein